MPVLGKKYPTPIIRPLYPFLIAGGVIFYGIVKVQGAMLESDEFKNDPRNPNKKH